MLHILAGIPESPSVSFIRLFTANYKKIQCYIQTDNPTECHDYGADYIECLHNQKAVRVLTPCIGSPRIHSPFDRLHARKPFKKKLYEG